MDCHSKVLIEGDIFYIAQCQHCGKISLQYNNILVKFSESYFLSFCVVMENIEFHSMSVLSPKGTRQIVLSTGHQEIQFTFGHDEFEELKDIIQQVKVILDAKTLLLQSETHSK
jgi:hypothetical protein